MSDNYNDYELELMDAVREHGWFCLCVGADPESQAPGFAYSIGFMETLGTPEFILFGLDFELMHAMLWEVFHQLQDGRKVHDGDRMSGVIGGFDCIIRDVHPSSIVPEFFNSALWYRRHRCGTDDGFRAMQIVWPGAVDGRFPWEPEADPFVQECQPPLYLPNRGLH
ncbi:MAG: DUF4262 domain-containing protein [Sphingosinicella sp.]|uniref:DUF4262 domain-containing protein n=1 Tax=Sphingosinicella sp. TaxID=1917971 RepID=UPI004037F06E